MMARSEGEEESQARLGSGDWSLACVLLLRICNVMWGSSEQVNRTDHHRQLG